MQIDVPIPDGKSGDFRVNEFTVTPEDEKIERMRSIFSSSSRGRFVPAGTYKRLLRGGTVVMSNTPDEISDHISFILSAKGDVLINGLGLGVCIFGIFQREKEGKLDEPLKSITVIEAEQDVIDLVAPHISDPRVTVIHADALTWKAPKNSRWNSVWHDIWDYICSDNLEDMKKLHRRYGRRCNWQGSWCRWRCEDQLRRDNYRW